MKHSLCAENHPAVSAVLRKSVISSASRSVQSVIHIQGHSQIIACAEIVINCHCCRYQFDLLSHRLSASLCEGFYILHQFVFNDKNVISPSLIIITPLFSHICTTPYQFPNRQLFKTKVSHYDEQLIAAAATTRSQKINFAEARFSIEQHLNRRCCASTKYRELS